MTKNRDHFSARHTDRRKFEEKYPREIHYFTCYISFFTNQRSQETRETLSDLPPVPAHASISWSPSHSIFRTRTSSGQGSITTTSPMSSSTQTGRKQNNISATKHVSSLSLRTPTTTSRLSVIATTTYSCLVQSQRVSPSQSSTTHALRLSCESRCSRGEGRSTSQTLLRSQSMKRGDSSVTKALHSLGIKTLRIPTLTCENVI